VLQRLHFSGFFLIAILIACGISLLFASDPVQMTLLFLCILGLGAYLPVFIREAEKQQKNTLLAFQSQTLHQAVEQFSEYAIFSIDGKLIKSSHPHLYPTLEDFIQKLDKKFEKSEQWPMLKRWIEELHMGELLLKFPQSTKEKQHILLARVLPQDLPHFPIKSIFISFEDITTQLKDAENIQSDFLNLERFIDNAPFAVFYLNRSRQIIACNQTLCDWLKQTKEEIVNSRIEHVMDGIEDWQTAKIKIIQVKPFKYPPFKAIWFPPTLAASTGASIICRIDGLTIGENTNNAAEETFLKASIPAVIIHKSGEILSFNQAFQGLIEIALPNETVNSNVSFLNLLSQSAHTQLVEALSANTFLPVELTFHGSKTHCIAYISQIDKDRDEYLLQLMDISQQKRLEQQFIQSQKMQAVGQLAGGIAHDFNNLLTAMIGFCDLLLQRYMPNDPSYLDVSQIKQNANRAANLVRQLLAFSRQQTLQPRIVNITDALAELSALLRRLIGAKIDLDVVHGREIWPVKVDVSQFEQVIINLAVNSRDAMADGGKLSIKTNNLSNLKPIQVGHETMPVGDFVVVEVTDTGTGIKEENLEHIFEPFFSTKEVGAGTGLGLATVYGIVKQTGGFIFVESEINVGTTFRICLPRYSGVADPYTTVAETHKGDLSGSGTVLLVEDEDAVRMFSARALREKGYQVIEACNGEVALETIAQGTHFDVLVTDVVMPQMDGPELNRKVREIIPNLKTIFISGYTEDAFRKNLGDDTNIHFLPKPFTLKDLAAKVKDVLSN
jgi:two-component system cell cycle sensor histidine kinase/response regulator CckA